MHTPVVINYSVDGKPAYLTGELFSKHPTEPNLWKFYGRVEDQISSINGEEVSKLDVVSMEGGICPKLIHLRCT